MIQMPTDAGQDDGLAQNTMLSDAIFKPMLFSTPMVQAILDGRKTMTRRIVKPQPIDNTKIDGNFYEGDCKDFVKVDGHPNWKNQFVSQVSKIQKGDIIWVRETWQQEAEFIQLSGGDWSNAYLKPTGNYLYKADGVSLEEIKDSVSFGKWKPSIFMPKSACRLFLEVTKVEVQRLQDISNEDAKKEGVQILSYGGFGRSGEEWKDYLSKISTAFRPSTKSSFSSLWQSINGVESWNENPYVWVYTFKIVECPLGFR